MKILLNYRGICSFFIDIFLVIISWLLAFYLRFNFNIPDIFISNIFQSLAVIIIIQAIIFSIYKLFKGTWRYVSVIDLKKIIIAVSLGTLTIVSINFILTSYFLIPRSVFVIYPLLLIFFMGGIRFFYRILCDNFLFGNKFKNGESVVIIGSGSAAVSLIKDILSKKQRRIVSILDDNSNMHGREIMGLVVRGNLSLLPEIQEQFKPSHIIVAIPDISYRELNNIIKIADELNLKTLTIPSLNDLITGRASISRISPIKIEDLLGRDSVKLDNSGIDSLISNNTILISGAGGSIGSELYRQIIKFKPKLIICLDISESALYILEQEFSNLEFAIPSIYIVGNVRNETFISKLLQKYKPKIIYHAAAYKHVPMMEKENVAEAIFNNVLGTYILANTAQQKKIDKFVLVSTDKAVNPTNVMGASKRIAELICQNLQKVRGTSFIIVRFGNVLGSSGSVIPKFKDQISKGGPVTVTHPDMTRYFMSVQEASQLVMQASFMGKGGEIFVLDMGNPIKINNLALNMIRLSGLSDKEIKIEYSGVRPGEKLYEEVLLDLEKTIKTSHKKLRVASSVKPDKNYNKDILKWISTLFEKEESLIKKELKLWVKEYKEG
jgi:FlaA1/EpsC-like NDP-sugar epimerase